MSDQEKLADGLEVIMKVLLDILEEDMKQIKRLEDYFHGKSDGQSDGQSGG